MRIWCQRNDEPEGIEMNEYNQDEWDAKIEAAAQAVIDGNGTEEELEAVIIAASDDFAASFPVLVSE